MDSLRRLAQLQAGEPSSDWTDADAEPGTLEYETHRFKQDLDAYRSRSADATGQRRQFISAAELLGKELPKTPWLVSGVLPAESVCVIGGEPKTLKTWCSMDLALSIAAGSRAFGEFHPAVCGKVALHLLEDGQRSARSRLASLARGHGLDPTEALRNIYLLCRAPLDLGDDRSLCVLGAELRMLPGGPLKLLVVDPLRDAHRGEEDQSGPMSEIMGRLRALRDLLDCTILVVHHAGKSSPGTSNRRPGQRLRGSSAIHGAIDGGLYLTLKDSAPTDFLNAAEIELKAAAGAGRFNLRLQIEDDLQGEAINATWRVERPDEAVSIDAVGHVIAVLEHAEIHEPGGFLSANQLVHRTHRRRADVLAALRQAEAQGRIRQVRRGAKPIGWQFAAERHLKAVPPPTDDGEKK